jgi:hypothetical protein
MLTEYIADVPTDRSMNRGICIEHLPPFSPDHLCPPWSLQGLCHQLQLPKQPNTVSARPPTPTPPHPQLYFTRTKRGERFTQVTKQVPHRAGLTGECLPRCICHQRSLGLLQWGQFSDPPCSSQSHLPGIQSWLRIRPLTVSPNKGVLPQEERSGGKKGFVEEASQGPRHHSSRSPWTTLGGSMRSASLPAIPQSPPSGSC